MIILQTWNKKKTVTSKEIKEALETTKDLKDYYGGNLLDNDYLDLVYGALSYIATIEKNRPDKEVYVRNRKA